MSKVKVVRVDDNTRAKVVCSECGRETYVYLLSPVGELIAELKEVEAHVCR